VPDNQPSRRLMSGPRRAGRLGLNYLPARDLSLVLQDRGAEPGRVPGPRALNIMPGKKQRSGRPRGAVSWTPTAFAGIHLISYRLWWQLGVPFWVGPDKQLVEPSRPGAPLPAAVDRLLAQMAIEHMVRVNRPDLRQRPRVERVIAWANRHCEGQIGSPTVDCSARAKRIHHG
jgi:hypothetical protein